MFLPEMTILSSTLDNTLNERCAAGYRNADCTQKKVCTSLDPRLDQLIVYNSLMEHLLQQKLHYEQERDIELIRLERFKREGVNDYCIKVQQRVVHKVQGMLPAIVFKLRNEYDKFERFLHREQTIKELDSELYNKGLKLLCTCRENLKRTL